MAQQNDTDRNQGGSKQSDQQSDQKKGGQQGGQNNDRHQDKNNQPHASRTYMPNGGFEMAGSKSSAPTAGVGGWVG